LNGATTTAGTDGAYIHNTLGAVPFSLSNGVTLGASHTVAAAAPLLGTSYVLVTKHLQGDSCYGRDSDSTSMYKAIHAVGPATILVTGDVTVSTANVDNLAAGGLANCGTYNVM
jgi:hypothetical protein